jgi:para-nitrobenzyl esterase
MSYDPVVRTAHGPVIGRECDGLYRFLGIPYASPPIGNLRWQPTQPPQAWVQQRSCQNFGKACPQPLSSFGPNIKAADTSEDCLFLNIWTPSCQRGERLPVMVWIHGGAFYLGAGSQSLFDGAPLARRGAVVVTINYRLGPFGFLASPLLAAESPHHSSGNYGLLDQVEALRWIQENVEGFGGDPQRVTLFGESAGAFSACRLMASPLASGLFHRVIAQSGGPVGDWVPVRPGRYTALEHAYEVWDRICLKLGCIRKKESLKAMRSRSAERILAAAHSGLQIFRNVSMLGPVIDGWVLPENPALRFARGVQEPIPLLIGINLDEGTLFREFAPVNSPLRYRVLLRLVAGNRAHELLALYPARNRAEVFQSLDRLITLLEFIAPARFAADSMQKHGVPAFLYQFSHRPPTEEGRRWAVYHGAEIPYVFGGIDRTLGYDESDQELSRTMMEYWLAFAESGNPNGSGRPTWPTYDGDGSYLELGDPIRAGKGLWQQECDLADQLFPPESV